MHITVKSEHLALYRFGQVQAKWSARGDRILRYYMDVRHSALNLHKEISAPELFILENKLDALVASWDAKYADHQLRQLFRSAKDRADDLTAEAQGRLAALERILTHTLAVNDRVDWDSLKDKSPWRGETFREAKPVLKERAAPEFTEPRIAFFDLIFGRTAALMEEARAAHARAVADWESLVADDRAAHARAVAAWEARKAGFERDQAEKKAAFLAEQAERNALVDQLRDAVGRGEGEAVVEHATMVLDASDYGGLFEKSFVLQYHPDEKLLKVAYDLPAPDTLPTLKTARYVKATNDIKETHISEREKKANFDSVVYQIALRTLHELFEADEHGNLRKILFNGYVNFVDPASGQDARSCLLSVLVDRDGFMAVDLARVDPKTCFKSLKGVSAASLYALTPVPPVMEMDREDRRFVDARDVAGGLDAGTNLAAMPWEDFEHLVRELFEREFASRGGEVKVTQASKDGGVDAIAFDPDPITGGKIVIQAKRYTRTVGVSAVRDLYGTVMNEGASKGILVTTADYGPDAYQFANGKPLTLLNGANLLHMLEKHGWRARIDVAAARMASAD